MMDHGPGLGVVAFLAWLQGRVGISLWVNEGWPWDRPWARPYGALLGSPKLWPDPPRPRSLRKSEAREMSEVERNGYGIRGCGALRGRLLRRGLIERCQIGRCDALRLTAVGEVSLRAHRERAA